MKFTVSFNKKVVKKMSKDQFLKAHKHLSTFVDLGKEYDKINPPKKKEE